MIRKGNGIMGQNKNNQTGANRPTSRPGNNGEVRHSVNEGAVLRPPVSKPPKKGK